MAAKEKKRLFLLDSLRGITIVNMIFYHALYNYFMIFNHDSSWVNYGAVKIWQRFICIGFIFISGFSWGFSKSNLKRGVIISGFGILITLITFLFIPDEIIVQGILSFLGAAVLIMIPLEKILVRINAAVTFGCSIILFILFYHLADMYLGWGSYQLVQIPAYLTEIKFLTVIGIPYPGFRSSDYFPLLPWIFIFTAGYSFQKIISRYSFYEKIFSVKIPFFDLLGRHSLPIYLLHQPLLMLLCSIIFR